MTVNASGNMGQEEHLFTVGGSANVPKKLETDLSYDPYPILEISDHSCSLLLCSQYLGVMAILGCHFDCI